MISVRALFFGAARDAAGNDEIQITIEKGSTTAQAFAQLLALRPELGRFGNSLLLAVNREYAEANRALQDGDELAVLPPVSGGAETSNHPHDFFELTTGLIDVGKTARRVVLPECGATVTLDGYARGLTKGRRTLFLIYEAYEPMALNELRKLGEQAHQKFDIAHIGIVHRTGRLEIGETSVVIAVSAPHRGAAFEACEWAIKELKRTVPIWKKEVFEDGEVWVAPESADRVIRSKT